MTLAAADFYTAFSAVVPDGPEPILLAVSGGPDSTALMHAAARWARDTGRSLPVVATVDHGLRAASLAEARAVAAASASLGLAHRILAWTRHRPGPVSQEAARDARYGLLAGLARELGIDTLLTAHTRDDQAETVLMRMGSGSGPAGLAGMAAAIRLAGSGPRHVRPFLGIEKADLVATCRREGWAFLDDPSNEDARFERVRWRRLMPALAAEGLDAGRLARLAARMRRWDEALAVAADAAAARCVSRTGEAAGTLDVRALLAEAEEVAMRVIAGAVTPLGRPASLRLDRLEACTAALLAAAAAGLPLRRTLAGRVLSLDRLGRLAIADEGERRRGSPKAVTLRAPEAPHSLGIGASRA